MQDINGKDIKVGSRVAFAARKGSSAKLMTGVVEEVDISIYPGQPERKSAGVKTKGGGSVLKDAKELVVTL